MDNNPTDVGITLSDKSSSEEDIFNSDKPKSEKGLNIKTTPATNRFSVAPIAEPISTLKLITVPPKLVKPKLIINRGIIL